MSELIPPPAWIHDGLCGQTSPDEFFPDIGGPTTAAKRICNGDPRRGTEPCPVREQCLTYALDHGEIFGVWGGLSTVERQQLTRSEAA